MYQVIIENDYDFDPFNPLCHDDIIADYKNDRIHAYEMCLIKIWYSFVESDVRCDTVASMCGILLDRDDWEGAYSLQELDNTSPSPDGNHLNEIVNTWIEYTN